MKNKHRTHPSRSKFCVLRQLCNWIPTHLVAQLARAHGVVAKARTYSPWSHVVTLLYAQLTHAIGLNDVCDALRLHSGPLSSVRGATAPSRNALSHANKERNADMAEQLFWKVFEHLQQLKPGFAQGRRFRLARRFKRVIHVVDATVIQLVASCMDWAKHRRRKAAAKLHLRLDLNSFLPRFVIVGSAREVDHQRMLEMCAGIGAGEIVIFDKAYTVFAHLFALDQRGVFWVSRARENFKYKTLRKLPRSKNRRILQDELVVLTIAHTLEGYPQPMRRVVARVPVDDQEMEMVFLTNNLQWSAGTVTDLYRCRWQVEVFFKQIKQTLQLADFLGHSANAVRWQVWTALLVHVLLRFVSWVQNWSHSFTRLFTLLRGTLWQHWDVGKLLQLYGTAAGSFRYLGQPEQAYLPHLLPTCGTASS